jgi:tetratricopeptide (TPR) repeat protein
VAGAYDYDWKEAEHRFRLAMACDPVPSEVRFWYGGWYLQSIGRWRDGVEQLELALQEDPLNVMYRAILAGCLRAAGREEDAIKVCYETLELDEKSWLALFGLAVSHVARGMLTEALAFAERAYTLAPRSPAALGLLAGLLVRTGDGNRAEGLLDKLRPGQAYGAPLGFAYFHLICGEIDAAVDWVEKVIDQRHLGVFVLRGPVYKALRSSPRWPALMRMMNLPED